MSRRIVALPLLLCAVLGRNAEAVDVGPVKPVMLAISPLSTLYEQRTAIDLRIIETTVRLRGSRQERDNELGFIYESRPKKAADMTQQQIAESIRKMSSASNSGPLGWFNVYSEQATSVKKVRALVQSIDADEAALEQLRKLRDELQNEIQAGQRFPTAD